VSEVLRDPALEAAIARALPHGDDPRTDTQGVLAFPAPDGRHLVVLYDAWEFHMGATTEKVALVDRDARVLRLFPFECVSTGVQVCTWRRDGALFALALGPCVFVWSFRDQRFALAGIAFSASSIAFGHGTLQVLESTYRVGKDGGYYADGPAGARFTLANLAWHEAGELERYAELAKAAPKHAASNPP